MAEHEQDLQEIVARLRDLGEEQDEVSVHDLRDAMGERSYGPFLAIPALIELSPIGGIPGVPTMIALIIAIMAAQLAFGRKHLWLPGFLDNRKVGGDKLKKGMEWIDKPAGWIDRLLRPRLQKVAGGGGLRIVAVLCIILCCTVPPLELLPFASSIPMGAIALMGLGLMARDGVVILIASILSMASFWFIVEVANGKA
ncbi:exopolysaccharide biosynthesis protein [Falsirhodobacter sp. 20TX0035]|uniref:exopolysaccharide biosynthesis protein n=1 Tax=Falsirhodobacter sp. 20TX0035 TaxID=3022019 RepID=UPI002330352B|nr:exopolysaccharide biosynthesis protein [Falsirhodobacter sp. 20TX0035]MDB6452570.1 exopolysaccharide biosynthesis protein [Falsirhodobacter sp. 20TX0035]